MNNRKYPTHRQVQSDEAYMCVTLNRAYVKDRESRINMRGL